MSDNEETARVGRLPLPTAADLNLPHPSAFNPYAETLRVSLESRARIAAATGAFDATVAVGNPFAVDHTVDIASAFAAAKATFLHPASTASSSPPAKLKLSEAKKVMKAAALKLPKRTFPDPLTDPVSLWMGIALCGDHAVSKAWRLADPEPAHKRRRCD